MSVDASAQKRNYGRFDFEVGVTTPIVASKIDGMSRSPIPFFYLEGRWQLEPQPIDVGGYMSMSAVKHKFSNGNNKNYRTFSILAVADYQFGRGTRVSPYVGLGIGVSETIILTQMDGTYWGFSASPRVGVRLFKTLNLSTGWLLTRKEYSNLYCNIGFYF